MKNIKIALVILTSLILTNIVTYKLTYDYVERKTFLVNVMVDIINLKSYMDTGVCDDTLTLNIEGMYVAAANSNNIDEFSSICSVYKKEYFDFVNKLSLQKKADYSFPGLPEKIELGKSKIKKLCKIAD